MTNKRADYGALLPKIDVHYNRIKSSTFRRTGSAFDCVETRLQAPKPGKPAQVRIDGVKYYTHIIACMHNAKRAPKEDEEASHLCNNATCVQPNHLVFEAGDYNKSRIYCRLFREDDGFKCLHKPPCLGC